MVSDHPKHTFFNKFNELSNTCSIYFIYLYIQGGKGEGKGKQVEKKEDNEPKYEIVDITPDGSKNNVSQLLEFIPIRNLL